MTQCTYLDYNATTPILPVVQNCMLETMTHPSNPSALHSFGQQAKRWINQARRTIGEYINAHPDYLIFTSGGTESNNLALQGGHWERILVSALEHDSVYKACDHVETIPVHPNGLIDLEALESLLKDNKKSTLVSVTWAHNETGVIQPIDNVVRLAKAHGAFIHSDAVQALGRLPISFKESGLDLMTLSSHKVGGPQGAGVLVAKETIPLNAILRGGGQERNQRSGTENVAAIRGFATALEHYNNKSETLQAWQKNLEETLKVFCQEHHAPLYIYGEEAPRLANTTCLTMPGVSSATQVINFDLAGIAVSRGSACSSGRTKVSRALQHMGPSSEHAQWAVRISSGWDSKEEDFLALIDIWKTIYHNIRKKEAYDQSA